MDCSSKNNQYPSNYEERYNKTPKDKEQWLVERGESKCISFDPKVNEILARYGLDGIEYKNGIPDFSKLAWGGNVEIEGMRGGLNKKALTKARKYNFKKAYEALSQKTGVSVKELQSIKEDFNLTWHECNDRKTMQLIPTEINGNFGHLGGVGETNILMRVFGIEEFED